MSLRTKYTSSIKVGHDTAFSNIAFDQSKTKILDTLLHENSGSYTLTAGQTNVPVSMGDVAEGYLWYIYSTEEIQVTFSGVLGVVAALISDVGTYNTGFAVDTPFAFTIDGVAVAVTFTTAHQTREQVINHINATAVGLGVGYLPCVAGPGATQITISGSSPLATGSVTITTALATIGYPDASPLPAGVAAGTDPGAAGAPLELRRPVTPAASTAGSYETFLMGTIKAGGMTISNLSGTNEATVFIGVVGDIDASFGTCPALS